MKKTTIITIANQKGGVAKTTTLLSLGAVLEQKGYSVLYIDLDSQANASVRLKADTELLGTYELLANEKAAAKDLIQVTETNFNVITANSSLDLVKVKNANVLKDKLKELQGLYDFILIDTAPSLNTVTYNAIASCNYLLIPCLAKEMSLDGLNRISEIIDSIKEDSKANFKVGVVITNYSNRTSIAKVYRQVIQETAKKNKYKFFNTAVRECSAIEYSQTYRERITEYAPKSNATLDYTELAEELLKELGKVK